MDNQYLLEMFIRYATKLLHMPNKKLQLQDLKVPAVILLLCGVSSICFYGNYADKFVTDGYTRPVMLLVAALTGGCAAILVLGYFAGRAGYTQAGLEKYEEDALIGKPPI